MAGSGDSEGGNGNAVVRINATSPMITRWGPIWALVFMVVTAVISLGGYIVYHTGNLIKSQTETNRALSENLKELTILTQDIKLSSNQTSVDQARTAQIQEEMLKVLKETGEVNSGRHNELIGNQKNLVSQQDRMERLLEDIRENLKP